MKKSNDGAYQITDDDFMTSIVSQWNARLDKWKEIWPHHLRLGYEQGLKVIEPQTFASVENNMKLKPEVKDWLDHNAGRWDHFSSYLGFKDENAAFAFKMRWL